MSDMDKIVEDSMIGVIIMIRLIWRIRGMIGGSSRIGIGHRAWSMGSFEFGMGNAEFGNRRARGRELRA